MAADDSKSEIYEAEINIVFDEETQQDKRYMEKFERAFKR